MPRSTVSPSISDASSAASSCMRAISAFSVSVWACAVSCNQSGLVDRLFFGVVLVAVGVEQANELAPQLLRLRLFFLALTRQTVQILTTIAANDTHIVDILLSGSKS